MLSSMPPIVGERPARRSRGQPRFPPAETPRSSVTAPRPKGRGFLLQAAAGTEPVLRKPRVSPLFPEEPLQRPVQMLHRLLQRLAVGVPQPSTSPRPPSARPASFPLSAGSPARRAPSTRRRAIPAHCCTPSGRHPTGGQRLLLLGREIQTDPDCLLASPDGIPVPPVEHHAEYQYGVDVKTEYDPDKNSLNRQKHGLDLADGAAIFEDPDPLILRVFREEHGEVRFKIIGGLRGVLHTAVYVHRGDAVTRCVSYR